MYTLQQVLKNNQDSKKLINAVINQMGGWDEETPDTISNINGHGIDGGYHGFIYHSDTVAFWQKNKVEILASLERLADDLGEDVISMVAGFNCIKDDYTTTQIGKALFGRHNAEEYTSLYNALAWYAAEEVCRMFDN